MVITRGFFTLFSSVLAFHTQIHLAKLEKFTTASLHDDRLNWSPWQQCKSLFVYVYQFIKSGKDSRLVIARMRSSNMQKTLRKLSLIPIMTREDWLEFPNALRSLHNISCFPPLRPVMNKYWPPQRILEHTITLFVCHPKILHKHCFQFLFWTGQFCTIPSLLWFLLQGVGSGGEGLYTD